MPSRIKIFLIGIIISLAGIGSSAAYSELSLDIIDPDLLAAAMVVRAPVSAQISNANYMTIIDYRAHSND